MVDSPTIDFLSQKLEKLPITDIFFFPENDGDFFRDCQLTTPLVDEKRSYNFFEEINDDDNKKYIHEDKCSFDKVSEEEKLHEMCCRQSTIAIGNSQRAGERTKQEKPGHYSITVLPKTIRKSRSNTFPIATPSVRMTSRSLRTAGTRCEIPPDLKRSAKKRKNLTISPHEEEDEITNSLYGDSSSFTRCCDDEVMNILKKRSCLSSQRRAVSFDEDLLRMPNRERLEQNL